MNVPFILNAIAMAMGVATLVLAILNVMTVDLAVILLGIGLFSVSLAAMQTSDKPEE